MAETRFTTIRSLFDAFPTLQQAVHAEIDDSPPIGFVRQLEKAGKLRDAIAICAYLLGRREAVWWTCQSLRSRPNLVAAGSQPFLAAEVWLHAPNDSNRDIAFQWGQASDKTEPATWAAYAAGSSGRRVNIGPDQKIDVPPHLTAESARVAHVLSECKLEYSDVPAFLQGCLTSALGLFQRNNAG